jgi:acyl-CoA dehydrogenase
MSHPALDSLSDAFPHLEGRLEVRQAVRKMCARFDAAYWDRSDLDHDFPEEFFQEFAAAEFLGSLIPEEYGGGGGTTADMVAILEEVAASGGGLNACSSVHTTLLCVPSIVAFGTEEQRRDILPRIAAGELYVTFGVTEPDAGTDTTKITTRAEPAALA